MAKWNEQEYYYIDPIYQLEVDLQDVRRTLVYFLDEPDTEECFSCNRLRCGCAENSFTHFRSFSMDYYHADIDSLSEFDYSYFSVPDSESDESEFDYVDFQPPNGSSSFELDFDINSSSDGTIPTPPPASTLPLPPWKFKCHGGGKGWELEQYYEDLLQWVRASHPHVMTGGPDMSFPVNEAINTDQNLSWPAHPKSIWHEPMKNYSRIETLFNFYRTYTAYLLKEISNPGKLFTEHFY